MRTRAWIFLLVLGTGVGCNDDAADPGDPPPPGRYSPTSARLLSTGSPTKDEDPSVLQASDGSMLIAWFSDRADGAGDIYVRRDTLQTDWSSTVRVTVAPEGDFYPSLIQDDAGTFHMTWFRWYTLERGHILYSKSSDALVWNVADEESVTTDPDIDDWLPTPAIAADGTRFVYFVSDRRDLVNPTSEIYVASKGPADTDWSAPFAPLNLNSALEHDQLPFVARTGALFTLVWVRHDTSEPKPWENPKSHLFLSTSADGLSWTAAQQVTNDAGNVVHLFPSIYFPTPGAPALLWLSTRTGAPEVYEMPVTGTYPADAVVIRDLGAGYSHRVAATPTSGVYLGAWVVGPLGAEDVYYRFFER